HEYEGIILGNLELEIRARQLACHPISHRRFRHPAIKPLRDYRTTGFLFWLLPIILQETPQTLLDERTLAGDRDNHADDQEDQNKNATKQQNYGTHNIYLSNL